MHTNTTPTRPRILPGVELEPAAPIQRFVRQEGLLQTVETDNHIQNDELGMLTNTPTQTPRMKSMWEEVKVDENLSSIPTQSPKMKSLWKIINERLGNRFPIDWHKKAWRKYFKDQDTIYESIERMAGRVTTSTIDSATSSNENEILFPQARDDQQSLWSILQKTLGDRFPQKWYGTRWKMFLRDQDVKFGIKAVRTSYGVPTNEELEQWSLSREIPEVPVSEIIPIFLYSTGEEDWNKENIDPKEEKKLKDFIEKHHKILSRHSIDDDPQSVFVDEEIKDSTATIESLIKTEEYMRTTAEAYAQIMRREEEKHLFDLTCYLPMNSPRKATNKQLDELLMDSIENNPPTEIMEREPESHYEEIPANSTKKPKTKRKRASPKASSEKHVYETPTKPKFGAKRVAPQMETKAQSKPKVQKRSNSPKTKPRKLNVKMGVSYKENEYDNKQIKSQPAPLTQITAETQSDTETSNYNQLQTNEITSQEGVATSEHTSSNPSDQIEWQPLRTVIKNILGERFPDDWSKPSWITYFEEQDEIYASADRRLQEELINTTDAEDENDMRQSTSAQELSPLKDDELSIWTILKNKLGDRFPRRWKGMKWQMYMDEEDIKQGVKIVAKCRRRV